MAHILVGTSSWTDDRLRDDPQAQYRVADHEAEHRSLAHERGASVRVFPQRLQMGKVGGGDSIVLLPQWNDLAGH